MAGIDWVGVGRLNELRHCTLLRGLGAEVVELGDGVMAYSPGVRWVNQASGLGLSCFGETPPLGRATEDEAGRYVPVVDRAVEFYRERGVTPRVETCSLAPESLLGALAARGFTTLHYENVLAAELTDGGEERRLPPSIRIVQVDKTDEAMVRTQAEVMTRLFATPAEPATEEMVLMAAKAIREPCSIGLLAMEGDRPVGACGMETREVDGVRLAALWGAVVEPDRRRQGIQLAMLAHRMRVARELGCALAIIESKPGVATERNAARVGFALAYVRTVMEQRGAG